ncbi:ABC transporter permease [Paenibacillus aestuarii]|uniref:ABC transporter permease n=1 Tax=Paenibacillus aestuarii TaxID=516965 RepID=A0ABW0KIT5_9BACL|nr:ABC transporter permease [Paenibacillus aestuarii]
MNQAQFDTTILWQQRFQRYIKESMGYWQYAARSNFLGFLLFLVIISSYYYASVLQRLPTNYPYIWIALLLLVPPLAASPVRTLLRQADRMFLLRIEHDMGAYFRKAFTYSFTLQTCWTLLAGIVLWPLYHHCTGNTAQPVWLMIVQLLLVKVANLLGSWQESRFVDNRWRRGSVSFRSLGTVLAVYLQFQVNLLWASGTVILLILIWLAVSRTIDKFLIGWDYLIQKEKQQQARLYAFFNWFTDVPQLGTRITRRGWISGVTRWIPFKQDASYLYLYTLTLLRTELFSIVIRVTLIGGIAIFVSSSDPVRAVIFGAALLITVFQISGLARAHRYTFWLEMYPLNVNAKPSALAFIIWCVLLAQTCVLAIPLLIRSTPVYALVPIAGLAFISFISGIVLRRKFQAAVLRESQ